jgi:spore coat protein SA
LSELKQKYNIPEGKVVLYIGRLSPKKGTHILLKAMKSVMDENEDVALLVVGSKWYGKNEKDEYTDYIQNMAETLNGKIVFTGFIPPSDIPKHYNAGDIFICASQWEEPLARVHYEAMSAGLPIITTNRGGNAEVMVNDSNGIVIDDYKNEKEFKKNIQYLLDNPDICEKYGREGRKFAEEKYNWERVANDVRNSILKSINKIEKKSIKRKTKAEKKVQEDLNS